MSHHEPIDPATVELLLKEGVVRLSEAARHLPPARGKRRSTITLARWIEHGSGGIHLEGFRGPDKAWLTSIPALSRFLAAMTARKAGLPPPMPLHEQRARARGEAAQKRLEEELNKPLR